MPHTDAQQLLEVLSNALPAAEAILITNRYGVELAENISIGDHGLLPTLTAASRIFAGRLAEVTGRGQEEYISLYLNQGCYSVFEAGAKWIIGILSPTDEKQGDLPEIVSLAASTVGPAPSL